jgi:hypothetical protein
MISCRENEISDAYKNEKLHDSTKEKNYLPLVCHCSLYFVDNLPSFKLGLFRLSTRIFMHFLSVVKFKDFAAVTVESRYYPLGNDAM